MLGSLGRLKHPGKTFIGRIERGFDFLGYRFGPDGLCVAAKTTERFVARAIRLYEQEPGEACASSRFGLYVRRWVRWTSAGFGKKGARALAARVIIGDNPSIRTQTRYLTADCFTNVPVPTAVHVSPIVS